MKETFIVRTEWSDAIFDLSVEDRATIFDNLFYYHLGKDNLINLNNLTVKLVWKLIQPNLIRNIDQYDKRRDTSLENGKKGGRPKKELKTDGNNLINLNNNLINLTEPNETLYVSDSVIVPVSDSVIDIDLKKNINMSDFQKNENHDHAQDEIICSSDLLKPLKTDSEKKEEKSSAKKEERIVHGDFYNVFLTIEESQKLLDKYGKSKFDLIIEKLSFYKASNGKKYKSDYAAIMTWVVNSVDEDFARTKPLQNNYRTPGIQNPISQNQKPDKYQLATDNVKARIMASIAP